MNIKTPDRPDVPIAAAWRRLLLRDSDQACITVLATLALVGIGISAFSLGEERRGFVDLSYPVATLRVQQAEVGLQVDVNRAEWPEWTLLPRIGETLARRIVASRNQDGLFRSHEELLRVPGIGPKTLATMRPYLRPVKRTDSL